MTKSILILLVLFGLLFIAPAFVPHGVLLAYYYGSAVFIVVLIAICTGMRNELEQERARNVPSEFVATQRERADLQ